MERVAAGRRDVVAVPGDDQRPVRLMIGPWEPLVRAGRAVVVDEGAGAPRRAAVERADDIDVSVRTRTGVARVVVRGAVPIELMQSGVALGFGVPRSAKTIVTSSGLVGLTEMLPSDAQRIWWPQIVCRPMTENGMSAAPSSSCTAGTGAPNVTPPSVDFTTII